MQIFPERIVRQVRIPENGIGIAKRDFLTVRKAIIGRKVL